MRRMFATVALVVGFSCVAAHAAETELVNPQTVWRVWLATGSGVHKARDGKTAVVVPRSNPAHTTDYEPKTSFLVTLPPVGWNAPDFDDHLWGRYGKDLFDYLGGFGCSYHNEYGRQQNTPAVLFLRTRFGISDPAKAADLTLNLEYLGGAVVYVNGVEVGRSNMPAGTIEPYSLANDYPIEAYTTENGQTPLPGIPGGMKPEPKWASRYQARVRTVTIDVPARVLVKGNNVLAVELHRARISGPMHGYGVPWANVGIREAQLTSASGAGAIGYAEASNVTRVWNAQAFEQVSERQIGKSKLNAGKGGWTHATDRGEGISGISDGNPFDPVLPMQILVPRGGVGSGMVVLSDPNALTAVTASVKEFIGPGGAILSAKGSQVRFAVQPAKYHYCDTLLEKASENAKTLPVYLEVNVKKDQAPGWYVSQLAIAADGKTFQIPVQVFVTGYVVPEAKDFRSFVGVMHSPEIEAKLAQTTPWSDAHFAMMAKSLEFAGQLGNDIMYVPVMVGDYMGHKTGLIRWTKTEKGLQPEFSAFEKYLDLYTTYCAAPKAIVLIIWSGSTVKEMARAYESASMPTREVKTCQPLRVTQWDSATGTNTPVVVPTFTEDGAEAFWKPMLDGVHAIVVKRGWSERVIMIGTGGDVRPGQKTGELFRKWAPYARWNIYSHFSGDPGPGQWKQGVGNAYRGPALPGMMPGKQIAIGDLEVGLKEVPSLGEIGLQKYDFLDLPIHRWLSDEDSPPLVFRTLPLLVGRIARLGLDYWTGEEAAFQKPIWGAFPLQLLARSETGPLSTIRFQMIRLGFQDFEPRLTILEEIKKLPAEAQKPYQMLLNGFYMRFGVGRIVVSQTELGLDWPTYIAQTYRAAEELTGIKTEAKWEEPPK